MKISRLFLPFLLAIAGCATQSPPAKIDTERQAKIEKLLKELLHEDLSKRRDILSALKKFGAKEYENDIAGLIKGENITMRVEAALALVKLGAKEYINDITELLKNEETRGDAEWALGELGEKGYVKDIAMFLNNKDAHVRAGTVEVLSLLGSTTKGGAFSGCEHTWTYSEPSAKEYIKDIAELLKDKDYKVRGEAVDALGNLGAKEYAKDITELLKDKDDYVRTKAERVLKEWGYDVEKLKEKK